MYSGIEVFSVMLVTAASFTGAGFIIGYLTHKQSKQSATLINARDTALGFVRRQRELPVPQRHVRDADLDALEAGLRETA